MAEEQWVEQSITAGMASSALVANPQSWINRRVETVELLSREETRRQVSVDFTIPDEVREDLSTHEGLLIPISVLTKQRRRNFDLVDESGASVPVLGKDSNGTLAHLAVMNAALDVLPQSISEDAFDLIWSDLRGVVIGSGDSSRAALAVFVGNAEQDEGFRSAIWNDPTCRTLLSTLSDNYVLYAVLPTDSSPRRILKYSYGDDFDFQANGRNLERLRPWRVRQAIIRPGRIWCRVFFPGAWRSASFHAEIVIPEELRIDSAILYDFDRDEALSQVEEKIDRASLYAERTLDSGSSADAIVVISPERRGRATQAAITGVVVTGLLWFGVQSGLSSTNPDAAVSIVLAGAALYSGITANRGEHFLVTALFRSFRRSLAVISILALFASAALALQDPDSSPTGIWLFCAIGCTIAAVPLLWSAIRAAS